MKVEQLAILLKKDATELVSTLNLTEDQTEVDDQVAVKEIENFVKEISITKFSEGKKQAEGMAKRVVLTDVEKKIKDKFGVEGSNLDELIENASSKVVPQDDSKFRKEIDLWKAKTADFESKYNGIIQEHNHRVMTEKVVNHLSPIFEKFEFSTPKVKDIAVKEFVSKYQFEDSESGVYAKDGDKIIVDVSNLAVNHFKEYGKEKVVEVKGKPNVVQSFGTGSGVKTIEELMAEIPKAKTSEERAAILQEIQKLDTARRN